MKSVCFLVVLCVAGAVAFGQDKGVSLLNVNRYSSYFINTGGKVNSKYFRVASGEDYERIAPLGGKETMVDAPLEIALLSYSAGAIDVRPIEARQVLPAGSRDSGIKLAAAACKELQEIKSTGH